MKKLPGRVSIEDNVVFGRGGDRDLLCEVFTPPNESDEQPQARAAVLLVHGGGWVQGDRSQLRGYGVQLARYGFVCVCSEYRLATEAPWPAQIEDVNLALRWMRQHASELGIDADKIAVSGNSAGGHLALMAAGAPHLQDFQGTGGHDDASSHVAAVVAIYPPTDLRPRGEQDPLHDVLGMLFGGDTDEQKVAAASPLTHVHDAFPPTLLIHGNADDLVPEGASFLMYEALRKAGSSVELHVYDGAPHAFDAVPEFGHQITDIMALFLDRKVANPRPVMAG